jgi:hypothetical protein
VNRKGPNVVAAVAGGAAVVLMMFGGCGRQKEAAPAAECRIEKRYAEGALALTMRISADKVGIAELVRLEVEAVSEPGYEVVFPEVDKVLTGLEIRDERADGERLNDEGRIVRLRRYRLEPVDTGKTSIGGLVFEFGREGRPEDEREFLTTEPVEITVTSLLEELGTDLVIEDIDDVVEIPPVRWPWWAAGGAAYLLAVGIVVWLCLRRRKAEKIVRIFRPAHEIAYEILRRLAEDRLVEAGRVKEFYERLSDCLRHYIEYRFELRAPERTTEEFLAEAGRAEALAEHREDLRSFLEHCDLVKFAKFEPSSEQISEALRMVERFVDRTRSDACRVEVTGDAALEGGR